MAPLGADPARFVVEESSGERAFHVLRAEWDALWLESPDASHFQLWDFQHLYWKHVTPRAVPRCLTLRDGTGRCRAIAAVVRARDSATGLMTTASIGGAHSDYNMFLVGSGVPDSAVSDLLGTLLRRHRFRAPCLALTNVPAASATGRAIEAYRVTAAEAGARAEFSEGESHVVRLPATLDEYLASLGGRSRRDFGYDRRKLSKEHTVAFRIHEGPEGIDAVIDQIEAIDRARWGTESLYERPGLRAFSREFLRALAGRRLLLAFLLDVSGRPATFAWGALVRGGLEVNRIAYDPTCAPKLSVGKVANFYAIEECIRRGLDRFDLTRGGEAYKGWLGTTAERVVHVRVHRSGLDRAAQAWGARLAALARRQAWLRNAYRRSVGS